MGVPASYGGFETLVDNLLDENRHEFTVYCSRKNYVDRPRFYKGARLVYLPVKANGISSVIYDVLSIFHALFSGHRKFLVLGVSGAIALPIISLLPWTQIVTNIDGIEWRRGKWRGIAKYFLRISEFLAVRFSTFVVADNAVIADYVTNFYERDCKTIAYGGDQAVTVEKSIKIDDILDNMSPYAFSVCRIEPENNIRMILNAFKKIDMRIIFIGNWDSSAYGRSIFEEYRHIKNVVLLDPIYCNETLWAYRDACALYIHGHSAGGTNPSLVEMMHFGKPVAAYDCSFNRATMENKGVYFDSSDDLSTLIQDVDNFPDGSALIEIAKRRYTWDIVRGQYFKLFKTLEDSP